MRFLFNKDYNRDENYDNIAKADGVIRKSIEKLSVSSDYIARVDTEIYNISNKADNLIENVDVQKNNITNIASHLDDMCEFADNTLKETTNLSKKAEDTYNLVKLKRDEINKVIDEFDFVNDTILKTSELATDLQSKVNDANSLTVLIEAIAKQTKILSVNASIEAARAGIHGKGFGVVAEEIMKLSEQTADVNNKVDEIIKQVGILGKKVEKAMNNTVDTLKNQSKNLETSVEDMVEVENASNEFVSKNNKLATDSNLLNDKIYDVKKMIEDVSSITNQNMNSTVDVRNSIKDEVEQIKKLSKTINKTEDKLFESLNIISNIDKKNESKLIVGHSLYEPFSMLDKNNNPCGIDLEIVKKAFKMSDIDIEVMLCTWEGSLKLLEMGLIDIITTVGYSKERESYMLFSGLYRPKTVHSFYSLKSSNFTIRNYNDLYNKRIGVQNFKYNDRFQNDVKLIKDNTATDIKTMFKRLEKGQIDCLIANEYCGNYYIKSAGIKDKIYINPFTFVEDDSDSRVAFSRKNNLGEYLDIFNKNIHKMIKDGSINNIEGNYI